MCSVFLSFLSKWNREGSLEVQLFATWAWIAQSGTCKLQQLRALRQPEHGGLRMTTPENTVLIRPNQECVCTPRH